LRQNSVPELEKPDLSLLVYKKSLGDALQDLKILDPRIILGRLSCSALHTYVGCLGSANVEVSSSNVSRAGLCGQFF
jgi:hypothetical protein